MIADGVAGGLTGGGEKGGRVEKGSQVRAEMTKVRALRRIPRFRGTEGVHGDFKIFMISFSDRFIKVFSAAFLIGLGEVTGRLRSISTMKLD
jgi:hypothetical protein